ncbi:hypothetical protein [Salinibacter altiplanensis]|uniref:hypothetical protein n=1 Tax=Salinibacter altiplanensis TaxID=1803181 RepID=UPI000C9FA3D4|nr:hypothetical protein [Salinibacter altiplanensis]
MYFRSALLFSCVALALLLVGCRGGGGLDVAQGQYRFVVEGSLADTLTGPATVQSHDNGRVGIELGARGAPGLSMELVPAPADRPPGASQGRYEAVQALLPDDASRDSLSQVVAFLSLTDAHFIAAQGHLSVTHADDGTLRGTVNLKMSEQGRSAPRTIRVTGVLRATAP